MPVGARFAENFIFLFRLYIVVSWFIWFLYGLSVILWGDDRGLRSVRLRHGFAADYAVLLIGWMMSFWPRRKPRNIWKIIAALAAAFRFSANRERPRGWSG